VADGVDAADPELATVGDGEGGDRADEGGLAGAVGAEHRDDLAAVGDEVEAGKGLDLAEALGEASGLDDRGAHGGLLSKWNGLLCSVL
jgi:hypothetical protein